MLDLVENCSNWVEIGSAQVVIGSNWLQNSEIGDFWPIFLHFVHFVHIFLHFVHKLQNLILQILTHLAQLAQFAQLFVRLMIVVLISTAVIIVLIFAAMIFVLIVTSARANGGGIIVLIFWLQWLLFDFDLGSIDFDLRSDSRRDYCLISTAVIFVLIVTQWLLFWFWPQLSSQRYGGGSSLSPKPPFDRRSAWILAKAEARRPAVWGKERAKVYCIVNHLFDFFWLIFRSYNIPSYRTMFCCHVQYSVPHGT